MAKMQILQILLLNFFAVTKLKLLLKLYTQPNIFIHIILIEVLEVGFQNKTWLLYVTVI